jgi:hypothetical protein
MASKIKQFVVKMLEHGEFCEKSSIFTLFRPKSHLIYNFQPPSTTL